MPPPSPSAFLLLTDADLLNNRFAYDIDTIVWNIQYGAINLRTLVRTQTLTPYVCCKYVVFGGRNEMYACGTEDAWISTDDILRHQPHISSQEMSDAHRLADAEDAQENEQDTMTKEDTAISSTIHVDVMRNA
jgi:hypothetical protein